jgi:hypothetical protein
LAAALRDLVLDDQATAILEPDVGLVGVKEPSLAKA